MSLKIGTRTKSGVTVIELEGNVTLGEASAAMRDVVRSVIVSGQKRVLLDLAKVGYIDSAGLGELVGAYAAAESRGTKLKLLHLQKKVKGLMQITRLITVFEAFEDEAEAIRSFDVSASASAQA